MSRGTKTIYLSGRNKVFSSKFQTHGNADEDKSPNYVNSVNNEVLLSEFDEEI